MQFKIQHISLIAVVVTALTILTQIGSGGPGIDFTAPPGKVIKKKNAEVEIPDGWKDARVDKHDQQPLQEEGDQEGKVTAVTEDNDPKEAATELAKNAAKEDAVVGVGVGGEEDLLLPFIEDATFDTRCKATVPPLGTCPGRRQMERTETVGGYTLKRGITSGPTTKGMTVINVENGLKHHPIFIPYATRTYTFPWMKGRVAEFVGVHTDYNYDCENHIAAGDFRSYHQVRGAMCNEHEDNERTEEEQATKGVKHYTGMYPLVDEEYYEYIMTLMTAYDAAKSGRPYTFVELGSRYGTWIVRAGGAYTTFASGLRGDEGNKKQAEGAQAQLKLLAVEGNCEWFQKMHEHVNCNGFQQETDLILAYAAPRSYNEFKLADKKTHNKGRAVSLLDMLPRYKVVDMMDLDIQGFEWLTINEPGVFELLSQKVAFLHFGTHSTDIEKKLLNLFQKPNSGWCVVYVFNGAHTKKLNRGTKCTTPYGPSLFNDGVIGMANSRFYPQVAGEASCPRTPAWSGSGKNSKLCYSHPLMTKEFFREGRSWADLEGGDTTGGKAEEEGKQEGGGDGAGGVTVQAEEVGNTN